MAVETPTDKYLDHSYGLILKALAYRGEVATEAYLQWRSALSLSDAPYAQHQAFPLLAEVAEREKIQEAELKRLQGVARNLWSRNTAIIQSVLQVLDILGNEGIVPIAPGGLGLLARQTVRMSEVSLGPIELVLRCEEQSAVQHLLGGHGYVRVVGKSDANGTMWRSARDANSVTLRISPLPNVTNRRFVQRLFSTAVSTTLNSRPVLVMSPTYQLFCAMAHPVSVDEISRFARVLDGYRLLNGQDAATIDWSIISGESQRFGLSASISAFLEFLASYTALELPMASLDEFKNSSGRSGLGKRAAKLGLANQANARGRIMNFLADVRYSRHCPEVLMHKAAWAARQFVLIYAQRL